MVRSSADVPFAGVLRALANDQETRVFRLKLVDPDENVDPLITRAAMRSLMHETPDVIPKILVYLERPGLDGRKLESAGAFRVTVESFKPFPGVQVQDWKTRIQASFDSAPAASPATPEFKTALSMVLEVLERAGN